MKITINVDCTPEEARRYMGLPDVAPMQEAMLKEMQDRVMANVRLMQPTEMMQTWLPTSLDSWLDMQKQFWSKMMSPGSQSDD
ncbi:MAG: hypothetical protein KDA57_18700 [Planctomycetales bacterium]|nr:hypothetical protein [Planctomycetales bacterium]